MASSAVISECGQYRYRLDRSWGYGPRIVWMMLNPSTADAEQDDPTIRRVIRFSRDWGYDACTVLNVYAYRATKPADLFKAANKRGPDWLTHFEQATSGQVPLVAAWGVHAGDEGRALARTLTNDARLGPVLCLGKTKGGHPRHPLYVRADTRPIPLSTPTPSPTEVNDGDR